MISTCTVEITLYALKAQKIQELLPFQGVLLLVLLPFQGVWSLGAFSPLQSYSSNDFRNGVTLNVTLAVTPKPLTNPKKFRIFAS